MKTHAIIPIFIPHLGCPNDCVFCSQKTITAREKPVTGKDMIDLIERNLSTLEGRGLETIEIAFFGGSFTGIPQEQQRVYLAVAKGYKDRGRIGKIRLSTRPDYIDAGILDLLKQYGVDLIELGVQSFDEEVLRLSGRGHSRESIFEAAHLIKEYGFELGLQLMIGLPGDTYEKSVKSAKTAATINPSVARLYPTVIIKGTELYEMYHRGEYVPFSSEDMLRTVKDMYRLLTDTGVRVIRVGLKSTDLISEAGEVVGDYHPAFRQLVEGEIAKEQMESQLEQLRLQDPKNFGELRTIAFASSPTSYSNMIGNRKTNRVWLEKKYPHVRLTFHVDNDLPDGQYRLISKN
jgi:histone acetyltransferase (RNA polymerase elongator complex component)